MQTISFLLLSVLLFSCSKNKDEASAPFSGVWVETSLGKDTLDFEADKLIDRNSGYAMVVFNSNTYTDTVLNPANPVNHSTLYNYYFNERMNVIYMRDILSSNNRFPVYNFTFAASKLRFTIDKFYMRRSLPAIIEFERIK
jgi:hypothetical protein